MYKYKFSHFSVHPRIDDVWNDPFDRYKIVQVCSISCILCMGRSISIRRSPLEQYEIVFMYALAFKLSIYRISYTVYNSITPFSKPTCKSFRSICTDSSIVEGVEYPIGTSAFRRMNPCKHRFHRIFLALLRSHIHNRGIRNSKNNVYDPSCMCRYMIHVSLYIVRA